MLLAVLCCFRNELCHDLCFKSRHKDDSCRNTVLVSRPHNLKRALFLVPLKVLVTSESTLIMYLTFR